MGIKKIETIDVDITCFDKDTCFHSSSSRFEDTDDEINEETRARVKLVVIE